MKRTLEIRPAVIEPVDASDVDADLDGWLSRQAAALGLSWLLAHADDGVIWGRWDGSRLETSHEVAPSVSPPLRAATLQTARLFAPHAELLLWRTEGSWLVRSIRDMNGDGAQLREAYDEEQILWGTHGTRIPKTEFVVMSDGRQGLRHAVPLPAAAGDHSSKRPLRLRLRHYIQDDATGFARVAVSRLVDLTVKESRDVQR